MTAFLCVLALLVMDGGKVPNPVPTPRRPAAKPSPVPRPTPPRRPAPPGLSWEDADNLERTLARIERRLRSGRAAAQATVVVSQRQVNSYLNLSLGRQIPQGVSDLQLVFERNRLGARALLDLDRLREVLPRGAMGGVLALLGGTVPVEILGSVWSGNGTGRVRIEQATVGGVSVPASLLAQIVSLSTRSQAQPGGFDILAPFRLPWTARQVRLEPGRALVDFYSPQP